MLEGRVTGSMAVPQPGEQLAPSDGVEFLKLLVKERGPMTTEGLRRFGRGSSVLTLKDGMGEFAGVLEERLRGMENVKVQCETEVERIWKKEGGLAVCYLISILGNAYLLTDFRLLLLMTPKPATTTSSQQSPAPPSLPPSPPTQTSPKPHPSSAKTTPP